MGSCVSKKKTVSRNNGNSRNDTRNVPEPRPLWETDPAQHAANQFIDFHRNRPID